MTERRKILFISYAYPPVAGGGAARVVRWTMTIHQAGFQPVVVTIKNAYQRGRDLSYLKEIEAVARIERTGSLDLKRVVYVLGSYWARFRRKKRDNSSTASHAEPRASETWRRLWSFLQALRNWFMVPDDLILWLPFALWRSWRLIKKERPALVITSSWPQSVQLTGLLVKKLFGIPWLVDFRDNWARHPYYAYPTRFHRALATLMEKWVVGNADLVTLAYGCKDFARVYPQWRNKFRELTNGFRESDVAGARPRAMEGFKLVYLGAFYGAHTPAGFFHALRQLTQSHPEVKPDLKVWMVGQFYPEHFALAEKYGVADLVNFHPFVPHSEIFNWLVTADALLLFLGGTAEAAVVPGKVFEYIRSPAWILAMIPEGETADILRAAGGALIVPFNQSEKIEEAILQLYQYWKKGEKPERIRKYVMSKEEDYLRGKMVEFINSLI
jgi:glycosyltransferase involved in cell wall biosynthesis